MKWTVGASRTLYDCPWFRLDRSEVTLPDGRVLAHHVIRTPAPSVAVLALDERDRVLLLYRHRFITDRWGWELPAGAAEPGEDLAVAAARELAEEAGVTCAGLEPFGRADLSNGLSDEEVHLYRGRAVTVGGVITSPEESAELRWFTAAEIDELLAANAVHDAFTQLALLRHRGTPGSSARPSTRPDAAPRPGRTPTPAASSATSPAR